ncbi:MAG: acetyl-CoA carboxylase biotin carboxyl carrier protein [Sedimentisphaerales bacterium]|nr:acetyl-CoA carboxylase biotin carboxyl carrier protein [Sedimentisphaerales bacterium]
MELEKVKELVELMKANELSELEIVDGQLRIALRRGGSQPQVMMTSASSVSTASPVVQPTSTTEKGEDEKLTAIKSPIVGTFYVAPSPTAEPFVKVGATVNDDTVVCIIEAMKVMNEVKAECSGTIKKILVENGAAVEFGQSLFLIEPA